MMAFPNLLGTAIVLVCRIPLVRRGRIRKVALASSTVAKFASDCHRRATAVSLSRFGDVPGFALPVTLNRGQHLAVGASG